MVACEIQECGKWWHHWCLMTVQDDGEKDAASDYVIFSPQVGNQENDNLIFICPDCLKPPGRGYANEAAAAMLTFLETMRRLKLGDQDSELRSAATITEVPETPGRILSSSADPAPNEPPTSLQTLGWSNTEREVFEPTRIEKFQGYDKSEVTTLMRHLDQSIVNFSRDTWDIVERLRNDEEYKFHSCNPLPLATWDMVDSCANVVPGTHWYTTENVQNMTRSHAPITAALREVLGVPRDMPLKIEHKLKSMPFQKVYATLIWWFVVDVLLNKIDIYELPNMKPMRIMMWAVQRFAEERWPKQGKEALQEVELRTWSRPEFQAVLMENKKFLTSKFDAFLEPMTKGYDNISKYSHPKHDLIEALIKLWSYFQSLRGTVRDIKPNIGDPFDPNLFQLAGDDTTLNPDESFRVAWIIRRGFAYYGIDGALVVREKAVVMVE
ncbi:hypothetical protein ONS95_011627 [Cadophora gregata]|uniref:uncharacterized protein n=1 Tax=Cadophora gregata TaxID=51156 RepID=UPI0026DD24F1|nr:uncharacterized protein ONS95_011627 [Cadophora gregata]KAK0120221.1 hypothetical protein ONS95_011627 [Cadophora gregata]KAK0121255.1 hypothetical protein ONS96_011431 [Cadophora gregata f. sp. sojae]